MEDCVYIVVNKLMTYKREALKYLHDRKKRGSLNQNRVTAIELSNNTSIPTCIEARSIIREYYLEGYNEFNREATPETTETESKEQENSDSKSECSSSGEEGEEGEGTQPAC